MSTHPLRTARIALLILATSVCLGGCKSNPSYFPFILPTGNLTRTHAKPPGHGYFTNFDPHACSLVVRPENSTSPVQSHQVLIATVYDEKGQPRRDRRIEWMVEGAGHIVEVDESGYVPARGGKVDNHYAVSYTDYKEHRITRGTEEPLDDFMIRPGQSWCVITSAVEGDTHVTVYAPGIANWKASKIHVTHHWVNALWTLPAPLQAAAGEPQVLSTNVFRPSDRQPLANYRVRYRILSGPPAVFVRGNGQRAVAVTDLDGNANVRLAQITPQPGFNRIGIEIIRAPDPSATSAPGIVIGRGETTVEWLTANVSLRLIADPVVALGKDAECRIIIDNLGRATTKAVTVRQALPQGVRYVSSDPPASREEDQLVWTIGPLAGRQSRELVAKFKTVDVGDVKHRVSLVSQEGQRDEKTALTRVTKPDLRISINGPKTGAVGTPIEYQVVVDNPGSGPLDNVQLRASFDAGLESDLRSNTIDLNVRGSIAGGQKKTIPLKLTPRQKGRLTVRVSAEADGKLTTNSEHSVDVAFANLTLELDGPRVRYLNRRATWDLIVRNPAQLPLRNVVLKSKLPDELDFVSATENGLLGGREVVWDLTTLKAGEERRVRLVTDCNKKGQNVKLSALVVAEPDVQSASGVTLVSQKMLQAQADAEVEIRGVPAYRLNVTDERDPIPVGERTTYRIEVTNQGSLLGNDIEIVATLPKQMRFLSATGPSSHTVEGGRVVFALRSGLAPKETWTYVIDVEATATGDARLQTQLRAATLSDPVTTEQSTTIFEPES